MDTWDATYFKRCRYDSHYSPYCPVFRIGDLVAAAGGVFEDLALLVGPWGEASRGLRGRARGLRAGEAAMCCVQGGAVGVRVHWDCDLDAGASDCRPHYSFQLQERSYNFRCGPHCPPAAACGLWAPPVLWQPGPTGPGPALWTLPCVCEEAPRAGGVISAPGPPAWALSSLSPELVPLCPLGLPTLAPPLPYPTSGISLLSTGGFLF